MQKVLIWGGAILLVLSMWALGFAFFSGLVWLVCWAFDLVFSWKYAFGLWVLWVMFNLMFSRTQNITVKSEDPLDAYRRWRK